MTVVEFQQFIQDNQYWVYGLIAAYALAKTGPLPMVAGFVSASGSLDVFGVLAACGVGTLTGANLRFALGYLFNTRLFHWAPKAAPWIALGAVGVDRLGWWLLPAYRFSKGTFTLIGLGAGITMRYRKFFVLDAIGATLWTSTMVGIGWSIGLMGLQLQPAWAAYVGLGLMGLGLLALLLVGRRVKAALMPHALQALERLAPKTEHQVTTTQGAAARHYDHANAVPESKR
jgi:membrane protein DedA with SNARE-associated domain